MGNGNGFGKIALINGRVGDGKGVSDYL